MTERKAQQKACPKGQAFSNGKMRITAAPPARPEFGRTGRRPCEWAPARSCLPRRPAAGRWSIPSCPWTKSPNTGPRQGRPPAKFSATEPRRRCTRWRTGTHSRRCKNGGYGPIPGQCGRLRPGPGRNTPGLAGHRLPTGFQRLGAGPAAPCRGRPAQTRQTWFGGRRCPGIAPAGSLGKTAFLPGFGRAPAGRPKAGPR